MISPELLRRHPFFAGFSVEQLEFIAMHSEEITAEKNEPLLKEGEPAETLFFILSGSADLFNTVRSVEFPGEEREFLVGDANPGEPLGISTFIEPYILTASARASTNCRLIKMDAAALRQECEKDNGFELLFLKAIARAMLTRLNAIRTQLAAAWA
jgi:CRP-like cAMP-binding protein